RILLPAPLLGIDRVLNRFVAPLVPFLCLSVFQTARPTSFGRMGPRRVSVIVPSRNEAGNIESAIERIPAMGSHTELILVKGHSKDDTFERIQHAISGHPEKNVRVLRQT